MAQSVYILRDSFLGVPVQYFSEKAMAKKAAKDLSRSGISVRVSGPIPPEALGLPNRRKDLSRELERLNASLDSTWEALP